MNNKNKYGQYFTKSVIADFMVSLVQKDVSSCVLEPSCGEGVFLNSLVNAGFLNLSAFEIDRSLDIPFDFVRRESFVSSPLSEHYDVIIGNPPYIRWKNLENELKEELNGNSLWNKYFNNLCDYLFIFILKSIEQLNDGGELVFICSEYWLNTTNSISLRNYMVENGYFSDIYHFKETPLFDNVTASLIIFRYVKSRQKSSNINFYTYKGKGCPSKRELSTKECFDRTVIPQFELDKRWILASKEIQERLVAFEKACVCGSSLFEQGFYKVGDFCDIGNGMVSGLDKAFQIDSDLTQSLNSEERKCIVPVLKAKDLDRYRYNSTSQYIMMPEGIKKDDFENRYPNFQKHLLAYHNALDARYKYGKDIPYWEFVFPRNYKLFSKQESKIFVPCKERISHKSFFRFCYAPNGFFPLQDVTAIVKKQTTKESLEYILAFLNTDYVFEWLKFNGIVKGAIVEFSEAPIASIPFKAIDWNDFSQVKAHDEISNEMRLYIDDLDKSHLDRILHNLNRLIYGRN